MSNTIKKQRGRPLRFSYEECNELINLQNKGHTVSELAAEEGVSVEVIVNAINFTGPYARYLKIDSQTIQDNTNPETGVASTDLA